MKAELFPFQQRAQQNLRMFAGKTISLRGEFEMTLRQEAIKIVNEIPEESLSEFINVISVLKNRFVKDTEPPHQKSKITEEEFQRFLNSNGGVDPKKAAAFARLEEWRKNNTVHLPANTDWKKEVEDAICEKYGIVD